MIDSLDMAAVSRQLEPHGQHWIVTYLPVVDSTNRYLRDAPERERVDRTAVVSDYQSAGRGRLGRTWTAPAGTSVLVSVLVNWFAAVPETHGTMLAALSMLEAVKSVGVRDASLKWPNDVVAQDRKMCGILTESMHPHLLLIGCGLNVNFEAATVVDIPDHATSVQAEIGGAASREEILATYLVAVDAWLTRLEVNPTAVFEAWRGHLGTLGQMVDVSEGRQTWHGQAVDVEFDGALVVRLPGGASRRVYAADVSVRNANFTRR